MSCTMMLHQCREMCVSDFGGMQTSTIHPVRISLPSKSKAKSTISGPHHPQILPNTFSGLAFGSAKKLETSLQKTGNVLKKTRCPKGNIRWKSHRWIRQMNRQWENNYEQWIGLGKNYEHRRKTQKPCNFQNCRPCKRVFPNWFRFVAAPIW